MRSPSKPKPTWPLWDGCHSSFRKAERLEHSMVAQKVREEFGTDQDGPENWDPSTSEENRPLARVEQGPAAGSDADREK
jgi:hypothetical protein